MDITSTSEWQVGTARPYFGSHEFSYLPFPGEMITERTNLAFIYVSMDSKKTVDLREFLKPRLVEG